MTSGFLILGMLTVGGAAAAMMLRNLVRSLLCLVVSFLGLAGLYLSLSATFVALTQVLVYVGAVAILLVFAILLTRGGTPDRPRLSGTGSWVAGFAVALLVFGALVGAVVWGSGAGVGGVDDPTVRRIGESLMTHYVLPLECIALLLTGAMLGAVVLAMGEPSRGGAGQRPVEEGREGES